MNELEVLQELEELEQLKNEIELCINIDAEKIKHCQAIDIQINRLVKLTDKLNMDIMSDYNIVEYTELEELALRELKFYGLEKLKYFLKDIEGLNEYNYFKLDDYGNIQNISRKDIYNIVCKIIKELKNKSI